MYDLQLALERRALDAALELAAPGPGDRVLDLGTGTGGLLRRLAARPDRPREVLGVVASGAMLARAPALPVGWRLRQADATRLPCPPGSYDVVSAAYLLHLLEQPARRAVLDEARHVPELKAAGFAVSQARRTTRGYPSLVVLAQPERN